MNVGGGWLYQHSVLAANKTLRKERRRREQIAAETMIQEDTPPDRSWQQLEPAPDHALAKLSQPDRDAIVLHFFGEQSLREVGKAFGIGEDAAQKRVARALERLRQRLKRLGITTSHGCVLLHSQPFVNPARRNPVMT